MAAVSVNLDVHDVVGALGSVRAARPPVLAVVGPELAPAVTAALVAAGAGSLPGPSPADGPARREVVLVGLGGLDDEGTRTAHRRAAAAGEDGTRWVLDPATTGRPAWVARRALHLLTARPTVVRATAAEVASLACAGEVVEGPVSIEQAFHRANDLARRTGAVVAVSGEVDLVTDGERAVRVEGGDPRLAVVPGVGTVLAALVAAYAAVVEDPVLAAVAAHAHVAVAAELAAGSGTEDFAAAWSAALGSVDAAALAGRVRLV